VARCPKKTVLGLDVDDAAGCVTEAGRQNPVEQIETRHEQRIDHRDERRIRVDVERNQRAVDLVLKLRPLGIANVDLRVLVDRNAGHLGQDIGDRRVLAGG
jgi:hypothetical protein